MNLKKKKKPPAAIEANDEPAEVEVKPILLNQAGITVVVESPSSDENSESTKEKTEAIARLGERIVEGAESSPFDRKNSARKKGIFKKLYIFHFNSNLRP